MSNFKLGDTVEVEINKLKYPGVVTTYKDIKSIAEDSDTIFLGPNLEDFIKLDDFVFVVIPNIYVLHVKEEYYSDPKYIGSYIVLPVHEKHIYRNGTIDMSLSKKIYNQIFED